jgi:hypothetical protein
MESNIVLTHMDGCSHVQNVTHVQQQTDQTEQRPTANDLFKDRLLTKPMNIFAQK